MENSGKVMRQAKTEEALTAAFAALDEGSEEEEMASLRRVAAARVEEECYA